MSGSGSSILQLVGDGLNLGVLGIVFYLFVGGKLHSDDEMSAVRKDNETLQAALERTRDALMLSNARNETGTLSAEIIAQALGVSRRERREQDDDRLRHRREEDDDRREIRRDEDDERREGRSAEDVTALRHSVIPPGTRQQRGGARDVPPPEEG